MEKNYIVIKAGERYTIAQWNESFKSLDESDGIYNHYFWDSAAQAQAAADKYNAIEGCGDIESIFG
ncbi:MAG: hypothetical protein FWC75_00870 [Oscillospiraceae bacterium]|nr:hypothetical protein [Oscillospiraceae bacterium]